MDAIRKRKHAAANGLRLDDHGSNGSNSNNSSNLDLQSLGQNQDRKGANSQSAGRFKFRSKLS